jgi:uncharacterized membrane protein YGL010W
MELRLNEEWSGLFEAYKLDHQDPRNQRCHSIGIPLILASIPVSATVVGLPLGVGLFSVGWAFQFAGHIFEGKKPAFVDDKRQLIVGALWWLKKVGADIHLATLDEHARSTTTMN